MKRGWQWPLLITLALGFTVGVNFVLLFAAGSDPNGSVVEEDYYRKAVEWDRTMARRAASAALGWRASATLSSLQADLRELQLQLRDASGASIDGADVSVTLIHNREAATPVSVALASTPDGSYAARAALAHAGQWEARIVARRGNDRFETSLRVEAP